MATLNEVCEIVWRQVFPNPSQAPISREEFIARGKTEYAASLWILSKQEQATEGGFEIPSELLTEVELSVVDNTIDISELDVINSLSGDMWLQNIGGFPCECKYVKSSLNQEKKLCDDDSIGDARTFYILGKKIMFPRGTHKKKLLITYANKGNGIDADIEVNEYVASKVSDKLFQLYGQRTLVDTTQNANPNN